jgi:hypothetical protein
MSQSLSKSPATYFHPSTSRRNARVALASVSAIVDALDAAFYATFSNVEPCNKPVLLARRERLDAWLDDRRFLHNGP